MTLEALLLVLGAYLWGGIPSAYLLGRYLKGIDIREYGSGNVGASNLVEHVGRWPGWGLGLFDTVGKGTLVVVVARLTDQTLAVQAAAGLAAVAGHNWSPYIGLTGGRGIATVVGAMLGLQMWHQILVLVLFMGAVGKLLSRETALWTLIGLLPLPLVTYMLGQGNEMVGMHVGFALLVVAKRLTANWQRPADGYGLARVAGYRLLWDRDVPRGEAWTGRRPGVSERDQNEDAGR